MGTFLHRLWLALAIFVSCGVPVQAHLLFQGGPNLTGACPHGPSCLLRTSRPHEAAAARLRGQAKKPSTAMNVKTGHRFSKRDGDGPAPDPDHGFELPRTIRWQPEGRTVVVLKPEGDRAPYRVSLPCGSKRGPPAPSL